MDRLGAEHPPIDLASVDYTIRRPEVLNERYGHVLDYMARVELEVDRNVLELMTMLPDPPEVDRRFYAEVWHPQETRHGLILDQLQVRIGRDNAAADLDHVSAKIKILGALSHLSPVQDVVRMLYYLTGMSTERSAVLAYNLLHDGLRDLGETALASTVVAQIRRQEPGHYAFYQLSARAHWARGHTVELMAATYDDLLCEVAALPDPAVTLPQHLRPDPAAHGRRLLAAFPDATARRATLSSGD